MASHTQFEIEFSDGRVEKCSVGDIRAMARYGQLRQSDRIRRQGDMRWMRVGDVKGLAFSPPADRPPSEPHGVESLSSATTAQQIPEPDIAGGEGIEPGTEIDVACEGEVSSEPTFATPGTDVQEVGLLDLQPRTMQWLMQSMDQIFKTFNEEEKEP